MADLCMATLQESRTTNDSTSSAHVINHMTHKQVQQEYPPFSKEDNKYIQQVLGSFLYYACAIDMKILYALSSISLEQPNPTERTLKRVHKLLDYMYTNPNEVIHF
jgi:hypothetical protein